MKKIAVLSALVALSATVAAGHLALGAQANGARVTTPAVDDPPPEPMDCPLCGGNPQLHTRRMLVIETLQGRFLLSALRW
jgi:hypothetical protein